MSSPKPSDNEKFVLEATIDGRSVMFDQVEVWWAEAEPPENEHPSFALVTSSDVPADAPHVEVECPAPEATTFRDLCGETFTLRPLSSDGGGWVSVDLGRDFKAKGFVARDWVAKAATVRFDDRLEDILAGTVEAELERSASKGGGPAASVRLAGRFRARAPRW